MIMIILFELKRSVLIESLGETIDMLVSRWRCSFRSFMRCRTGDVGGYYYVVGTAALFFFHYNKCSLGLGTGPRVTKLNPHVRFCKRPVQAEKQMGVLI